MEPASWSSPSPPAGAMNVTPSMLESLRATRPWVMFMGVMGFIGAAFMVLGTLGLVVAASVGSGSGPQGPVLAFLGLFYLVFAVLLVIGAVFLVRYAGAIGRLNAGGSVPAMEEALGAQKSYWKFMGGMSIAMIAVSFIGGLLIALAGISHSL